MLSKISICATKLGNLDKGLSQWSIRQAMAQMPQSGTSGAPPAELAYPAKVTLLQDWILVDGCHEAIRAGMRVSAEIKTGESDRISALAGDAGGEGSGEGEMTPRTLVQRPWDSTHVPARRKSEEISNVAV
jgi:hypothetical protein